MISWALIGISPEDFNRHLGGVLVAGMAADFLVTAEATVAESSSNSAGPGSAISSRRSLVAAGARRRLAAVLASAQPARSGGWTSKPTSWSHSRKRSTV